MRPHHKAYSEPSPGFSQVPSIITFHKTDLDKAEITLASIEKGMESLKTAMSTMQDELSKIRVFLRQRDEV